METATTRLLDALRASQGNCTDYRVSKLLGLDTAAVSKWRVGRGHMSMANIARACELAGFPERTWEWQIRIGAERERGPDGDIYRAALADMESYQQGGEPAPHGLIALFRRMRDQGRAAIILIACVAGVGSALVPVKPAFAHDGDVGASAQNNVYYGKSCVWFRRRPRRSPGRWLRFLLPFPVSTCEAVA